MTNHEARKMTTLSITNLAQLAHPEVCERCWWLRSQVKEVPWQIWPSIFRSIDETSKRATDQWFAKGCPPPWLRNLGVVKSITPPDWRQFNMTRGELQVRGVADFIGLREDLSIVIVDFKTASFTSKQDELIPIYAAQLNAYAEIAEDTRTGMVTALAIIYCEPQPNAVSCSEEEFSLPFRPLLKTVKRNSERILQMIDRAAELLSMDKPPPGRTGCRDCASLATLARFW